MDEDYALALQLQSEFFEDKDVVLATDKHNDHDSDEPKSLVDPYWELTDPNPDIRALFLQFNDRFFWGRLCGIEVRWSPRMTLCAGLCCYEGQGGLCSVRLSVPLLKLRPRKDLIETLLHEMIHAYLFVTDNNKDHDGHGPEFHKHMYRINKEAGTNISVYHNFHDEVDTYRQHWWRCDGPCRSRKPYFGYVKRAMNRAPSKNDTWWAEHQRSCGGIYTKVKEPEDYGKKKGKTDSDYDKKKGKPSIKSMDIRIFAGNGKTLGGNKEVVPSATISVVDDNSCIPTSLTSQNVTKSKQSSGTRVNKPKLTNDNTSNKKSSTSVNKYFLPGGKTPPKTAEAKNKPVSQGGVAKFGEKQSKLQSLDFSDSEDDGNILHESIPLNESYCDSTKVLNDIDNINDLDENINYSSEVNDIPDVIDIVKVTTKDGESIVSATDKTVINKDISEGEKHSDSGPLSGSSQSSDIYDVKAMLRKVWGQKQFESSSKFNRFDSKTKPPQNSTCYGGKSMNEKLSSSVSDVKNASSSVINSNKRLSDTELYSTPPMKRHCIDDSGNISEKNVLLKDENTTNKKKMITSPIDKYFNMVDSMKFLDRDTSCSTQSTNSCSTQSTNSSSTQSTNSSRTQLNSGSAQLTNSRGDEIVATHSSEDVSVESSTCPICNTHVPVSTINDHLDLCLTMQIL
ncbi:hypothetical protein ACF0H5_003257 [Mactra antiquata]